MTKKSDKQHKCPFCPHTSSRKYNINIHIQRKHYPYPSQINNANQFPVVNEPPPNLIDFEKPPSPPPSNWERSMEQPIPSSLALFPPPHAFNFDHDPVFYYIKLKEEEKRKRRESERSFNRTLAAYIQKIVIPSLSSQNTQFNYTGRSRISNIYIFFDQKNMPKAYKIYKCKKCLIQKFESFFDFRKIYPTSKFIHNCCYYYNQQQQQQKQYTDNNNYPRLLTLNLQETLLSIIDFRLKSENKLLKMFVFQDDLVKNPLALKILLSLVDMDIVGNKEKDDPFRWLFELLENEGFVDLGEIRSSQHWAKRAYDNSDNDNDGNYYSAKEEKVTKLEKEELKQFISITGGTFGLIKFKIDNKHIYTFSYLPLYNEKTSKMILLDLTNNIEKENNNVNIKN